MKEIIITLALLTAYAASGDSQIIIYTLLPGSTITPMLGSTPTGPTESLIGTFQLAAASGGGFNDVSLDFSSDSFHLTLQQPNMLGFGIGPSWISFGADVDMTGLSITTGQMDDAFVLGTYTGPMSAPDYLTFSDVRISPESGGEFVAQLTISAQQVPEPSSTLLLLSSAVLIWRRFPFYRRCVFSFGRRGRFAAPRLRRGITSRAYA